MDFVYFRSKAFFSSSNDSLFLISLPTPTLYTLNYTQVTSHCSLKANWLPWTCSGALMCKELKMFVFHKMMMLWPRRDLIGKPSVFCLPPTPGQTRPLSTPPATCGSSQIGWSRPLLGWVSTGASISSPNCLQWQVSRLLAEQFARFTSLFLCRPTPAFGSNPLHGQVEKIYLRLLWNFSSQICCFFYCSLQQTCLDTPVYLLLCLKFQNNYIKDNQPTNIFFICI